jgi:hypothetical protein
MWCSLWGTDWILKYHLDKLRLQRVSDALSSSSVERQDICTYYNSQYPSRSTEQERRLCEKWNEFMTVAILVARNENEAVLAHIVGSGGVCIWRKSKVRRYVLYCAFVRNAGSVTMKRFLQLIYFIKKSYKYCTFCAIFKDNLINKSECVSVCVCVCLSVCMFEINSLTP